MEFCSRIYRSGQHLLFDFFSGTRTAFLIEESLSKSSTKQLVLRESRDLKY